MIPEILKRRLTLSAVLLCPRGGAPFRILKGWEVTRSTEVLLTYRLNTSSIHLSTQLNLGVLALSKVLYCNDLVPGCTFEAHGDSEEEILAQAADHIATVHNMTDISDEILAMVRAAIHEEVRTRTRAARA